MHDQPLGRQRISAALFAGALAAAALVAAARPAAAELGRAEPSRLLPLRDLIGGLWRGSGDGVLEQRAIDEGKKKPGEQPPPPPGTPPGETPAGETAPPAGTPPPAVVPSLAPDLTAPAIEPKSPARAFLLSAAVPGLGELYSGSNRGYLFLGVEAVSWITYASYKSSASDKEDELYAFADRNFSIDAFGDNCVGQPGQPCQEALESIHNFYDNDKGEYYEIISKNPIYKTGWGVEVASGGFTYDNGPPPAEDTEEYRRWVANQAAKQDQEYVSYNGLRDDRNSLDRTARGMTMVALVNHLVSAWDALMLARGFNTALSGGLHMDLKFSASHGHPGATFVLKRPLPF